MASTLTAPKSHNLPHFIGRNYEIALSQSIEALLNSDPRNFTNFTSEFQGFVQSKADPPLESIWVYTALTFSSSSAPRNEPFSRISAIKDLFQLIVSCSASCNSIKSIALAAPVIYHLHSFILDVKGFQLSSKKERKLNGEIRSLVDSVLGYVNVCCNGFDGNFDELEGLVMLLGDLVSFWVVVNGVQHKKIESLRLFFPLLSDEIINRIIAEGCEMIDLAGFVVFEAFLLKLCWKIQEDDGFGEKMQNELSSWIVGSITGLGSSYFYVTLVSMLLEPVLPVTSLMREIANEFSTSEPTGSSPRAYLRWMLNIENRGIKIFDDDMAKFRAVFNSKEQLTNMEEGKEQDSDFLFYIDNKGQEENQEDEKMSESMNAAFMAAAQSMQSSEKGKQKRKTKDSEKRNQVKFVKYTAFDHSSLSGDAKNEHSVRGSDVDNPSSDEEDME